MDKEHSIYGGSKHPITTRFVDGASCNYHIFPKNNIFLIDYGFEGYYTNLHGDSAKLSYNLTGVGCKKVDVKSQPGLCKEILSQDIEFPIA
jgi:hypothetical protein